MRDLIKLMDSVYEAHNMGLPGQRWAPRVEDGNVTTFCNEAVNFISKRMGFNGFDLSTNEEPFKSKLANDIIDVMYSSPAWRIVDSAAGVQNLVNLGALVIACEKNPTGHGHVCVLIPGSAEYSGTWAGVSPKIMNIGKDVFIGKKASFAFSPKELPIYFSFEG